MKFALADGQRQEAQPNLSAECPGCGSPMVARIGETRVRHWAHKGRRFCDPWWETETDWHRNWKDQFPVGWQEFVQHAGDGERHIADVKTGDDWVIEFQHSYIKPEERRSREAFYSTLVWVVDGLRRKRDEARFLETWEEGMAIGANSPVRRVWSGEGALLRDWAGSGAHVFFDFGDEQVLWWLWPKSGEPKSDDIWVYVAPFPRAEFIESHRQMSRQEAREFDSFVKEFSKWVSCDRRPSPHALERVSPRSHRDFERDFASMSRRVLQGRFRPGRYRR